MMLQKSPNTNASGAHILATRRAAFESARAEWTSFSLDFEVFSRHLDFLGYTLDVPAHPDAVYLCVACSNGIGAAHRILEREFFPMLHRTVLRVVGDADAAEDTLQEIRCRLLAGASPKILSYQGRGSLAGWLRSIAIRRALDQQRARGLQRRSRRMHAEIAQFVGELHFRFSPEERAFQLEWARRCEEELRSAVHRLTPRDRSVLYSYFALGLNIDVLGAIHHADRSTIARRIKRSLAGIARHVRREMCVRAGDDNGALENVEITLADLLITKGENMAA